MSTLSAQRSIQLNAAILTMCEFLGCPLPDHVRNIKDAVRCKWDLFDFINFCCDGLVDLRDIEAVEKRHPKISRATTRRSAVNSFLMHEVAPEVGRTIVVQKSGCVDVCWDNTVYTGGRL